MAVIEIQVVSDFVCAWCYIAKRNLDTAISLYRKTYPGGKRDTFAITWTPYFLNYNPHPCSVDKLTLADERLADQTPEQRAALTARMTRAGLAAGIAFDWGGKIGPNPTTRDAHRLVHLSGVAAAAAGDSRGIVKDADDDEDSTHGSAAQQALVEAIFAAYHVQAKNISQKEVLREAALQAGLTAADVDAWLASEEAGDVVDREANEGKAAAAEAGGVPAMIIQGEYRPDGIPDPMDLMEIFVRVREAQG
ncbi:putative thioredoxin [Xylariales sp. PMI_506]|nr:putative thioredoxin [Xylariales sp. PMI_506]